MTGQRANLSLYNFMNTKLRFNLRGVSFIRPSGFCGSGPADGRQRAGAEFVCVGFRPRRHNEFTPGGVESTFASGLNGPVGLAFNDAGDLFEADNASGEICEFTPGGARSTVATGLENSSFLAFQTGSVPDESSTLGLLAIGTTALLARRLKPAGWRP
jgi:hypothetical protein